MRFFLFIKIEMYYKNKVKNIILHTNTLYLHQKKLLMRKKHISSQKINQKIIANKLVQFYESDGIFFHFSLVKIIGIST